MSKLWLFGLALVVCCFAGYSGARAQVTTVDCGGPAVDFLDTGGGSGGYSANSDYTETYGATLEAFRILNIDFTVGPFDIDASDTLFVYEGADTTGVLLGVFNNATGAPTTITTTGSYVTFRFVSDNDGNEGTGWQAEISCAAGTAPTVVACGTPAFSVDDGGNSADYSDDQLDLQSYRVDADTAVGISFVQLDIAAGDTLFVHNGPDETYPVIGTYTDLTAPFGAVSVEATGADVTFRFKANDDGNVAAGWNAVIGCVDQLDPTISAQGPPTICTALNDSVTLVFNPFPNDGYMYNYYWETASSPSGPWTAVPTAVYNPTDSNQYRVGDVGYYRVTIQRAEVDLSPGPAISVEEGDSITSAFFFVGPGDVGNAIRPSLTPTDDAFPDKEVTLCQGDNITLAAQFENPTGNLELQWYLDDSLLTGVSSDSINVTQTGLGPGTYKVAAFDPTTPGACPLLSNPDTINVTFIATPPPSVTINANGPTTFCQGGTVELERSVAPGVLKVSYQWYRSGDPVPGATEDTIMANIGGNYTVQARNACGVIASNQVQVIVEEQPPMAVVEPQGPLNLCEDPVSGITSSETIEAVVENPSNYNLQWQRSTTGPTSGFSDIPLATNLDYTLNNAGWYRLAVTDNNCTSFSNVVEVGVSVGEPSAPNVLVVEKDTITNEIPADTTTWTYLAPTDDNDFTPGTNDNNTTICVGDSVVLFASGGFAAGVTYEWYFNGAPIAGADEAWLTVTQSGTYSVRAINTCGQSVNASTPVNVTVNNPPLHTVPAITAQSTPTICNQGGNITLETTNYGTGYEYFWIRDVASGSASTGIVASPPTSTFQYDAPGSGLNADTAAYRVYVRHIASGCALSSERYSLDETNRIEDFATLIAGVSVNDAMEVEFAAPQHPNTAGDRDTICSGDSTLLQNPTFPMDPTNITTGVGPGTTYQWFLNGNPIAGATQNMYWAQVAGTYTFEVNNACGSEVSNSLEVVEFANTPVSIVPDGPTQFCAEDSVTLDVNTTATNPDYQWEFRPNMMAPWTSYSYPEGDDTTFVVANAANTGTGGMFRLRVKNDNVCAYTTIGVDIPARPFNPQVGAESAIATCQGQNVPLFTTASEDNYQWYIDTTGTAEPITNGTDSTFIATSSGVYTVEVSNICGAAVSQDFDVTIETGLQLATPSIALDTTTICLGDFTNIEVTNPAGAGVTYSWFYSPDNGVTVPFAEIPNTDLLTFPAYDTGFYYVKVENSLGCMQISGVVEVENRVLDPAAPMVMADGSTELCIGDSVMLMANMPSMGVDVSYQWNQNGSPISGATGTSIWVDTQGDYTLTVMDACGMATSHVIEVTVGTTAALPQPSISPANPILCQGQSQQLTANTSVQNPAYQWFRDGVAIPGATFSTYTATTQGSYTVEVANFGLSDCPAESEPSVLNYITSAPTTPLIASVDDPNICAGDSVTFELISDAPLGATFQWFRNGNLIAGATNDEITVSQAGNYVIEVTNACGTAESSGFGSTVVISGTSPAQPMISPMDTAICQGDDVTFTATNTGGFDIQWFRNGLPINNATGTSITVTQGGSYTVEVEDNGCTAMSMVANLDVSNGAPTINTISANGPTAFCDNGSVELGTSSSLSGVTSIQWLQDGNVIPGATSATYVANQTGDYQLVVANGCGTDTSNNSVTVTVTPTPAPADITPDSATICAGGPGVDLTANNVPGGATIQWFLNGNPIGGATSATYTATQAGAYEVQVDENGCTAISNAAIVSQGGAVPAAPTITPASPSPICEGDTLSLSIPSGSYSVEWFLDGNLIAGANGFTITVSDSGDYTAVVSTACGSSPASAPVTVQVTPGPGAPVIDPASANICDGGDVTLTATQVPGGATLQWQLNGTDIVGETGTTLVATAGGDYTVTATDGCTSTSAVATVTEGTTPAQPTIVADSVNSSITISNFQPGLTYEWFLNGSSTGQDTETITVTENGDYYVVASDNGCTAQSETLSIAFIGFQEALEALDVNVYPNPTTGRVVIEGNFSNDAVVKIFDTNGRVVWNGELTAAERNILTLDATPGVYHLHVQDGDRQLHTKLLLVK